MMMKNAFLPKLKIAIDGNEANVLNRVGSNVYAFEVLVALEKLLRRQNKFAQEIEVTVFLAQPPIKQLPVAHQYWHYRQLRPRQFFTQLALPWYLLNHQKEFDVFYSPGHYASSLCPMPLVTSIMDLAFLDYPKQFKISDRLKLTLWTGQAVKKARKIITISRFSKREIMRRYHRRQHDIVIAYPAVGSRPRLNQTAKSKFLRRHKINSPYLLYLGTIQPRKNLKRLIQAYGLLMQLLAARQPKKISSPPQLIIAGKIGWLAKPILRTIETSPFKKQIKLLGYVSEEEKHFLLSQASASIQVGLYEGFGIPVLEAYQFGTPVVASASSSLPESGGKAAIYVDETKAKSLAEGLYQAVNLSVRQRQQLKKIMQQHLEQFSWQQTAQTILKTLLEVV